MLPSVGTKSECVFESDIRSITEKAFYSAKPWVIFKSSRMLTPKGKDPVSIEDNSCVLYTFEWCCKNSYIEQTSRNLRTRIKELIPKCVENYIKTGSETTNTAIKKRNENIIHCKTLINSPNCGNKYDKTKFRIPRKFTNLFDLIKLSAILIYIYKPKLNKQRFWLYNFIVYLSHFVVVRLYFCKFIICFAFKFKLIDLFSVI